MAVKMTRSARKEQTRTELLTAAKRVFLRDGFHRATLDAIADEAGFTKGAVYSNFANKDELFLALLDEHYDQRVQTYREQALDELATEDAYRAVARVMAEADRREPRWWPVLSEFTTHAAHDPELRRALHEGRERFLDALSDLLAQIAKRHGLEFSLPLHDVVRGSAALLRGMVVERMLDPELPPELFVELHAAYMRGLTRTNEEGIQ